MSRYRYLKVFLFSFSILLLVLIFSGIYPFGSKTMIVSDLRDQYLPFINYLKSVFLGNNSPYFTLSASLGENFLTLAAYYLMSIFNIITILFKVEDMPLVLTVLILIKISLTSVSMLYFLDYTYSKRNYNYLFALCYGLMSYTLCFYFHIMWLDSIILLPIMVKGINDIIIKNKSLTYIISLTLIILSNYYIGVILCIFSFIYFVYSISFNFRNINKKVIIKYLLVSIFSSLICSFLLLPVFYSLLNGKAIVSDVNVVNAYYFNILDIISKLFTASFDYTSIWHGGPNLFVSSFIVYLVIIYFFNKDISKKYKIINLIILIFLFLTLRIHKLDLIFHGLTEPNCFDFRHAFFISFMLIKIGYESFEKIKFDKKKNIIILSSIFLIHIIVYFMNYSYYSGIRALFLILSIVFFILISYSFYQKKYKLMSLIIIVDLMINAFNTFNVITSSEKDASNLDNYFSYVKENSEVLNTIKRQDNTFYRIEKDYHLSNSINDSMLFNYYGVSHFDSTSNTNTEKFLENLGFRRLLSRAFYEKGSTRFVDMFLGIKYVLSYENSHLDYNSIYKSENINVFYNPYYVSCGYLINNNTSISYTDNVFLNMNLIYKSILDNDELYHKVDYEIKYHNVLREGNTYKKTMDDSYITYSFKALTDDYYYLYFKDNLERDDFKTATIYINNVEIKDYFNKYNYGMISLGKLDINDDILVKIKIDNDNNYLEFSDGLIYYEDTFSFNKIHNYLKENSININLNNSSNLSFNINTLENKKVLLTIPYEDGWEIYVDNKKINYEKGLNGLITYDINKGIHEVNMVFIPKGLKLGIIISVISFSIITIIVRSENNEKNKL